MIEKKRTHVVNIFNVLFLLFNCFLVSCFNEKIFADTRNACSTLLNRFI